MESKRVFFVAQLGAGKSVRVSFQFLFMGFHNLRKSSGVFVFCFFFAWGVHISIRGTSCLVRNW